MSISVDFLAEMHYSAYDPQYEEEYDEEEEAHFNLIEEAINYEIDYDDFETVNEGIEHASSLLKKLQDDDYYDYDAIDAIDHLEDEIQLAKSHLSKM